VHPSLEEYWANPWRSMQKKRDVAIKESLGSNGDKHSVQSPFEFDVGEELESSSRESTEDIDCTKGGRRPISSLHKNHKVCT
jgi:hypothetical protein